MICKSAAHHPPLPAATAVVGSGVTESFYLGGGRGGGGGADLRLGGLEDSITFIVHNQKSNMCVCVCVQWGYIV